VFNVLCFGLATAGFIFSKVLREIIKYWRSKSIRIIMYLDDGLPFINNLSISSETKLLLSFADLLLSNDMFTGRVLNGNL
jgi:hypothetical protein